MLHLAITGDTPRVFYVAEISWIASWFFFLSLQIMRTEGMKLCVLPVPAVCAGLIGASILIFRFKASYLVSGLFAVPVSAVAYLSLFRLQRGTAHRRTDVCFAVCTALQVGLFFVSAFMEDFTRFNLYFAVDIMLTLSLVALLILNLREVAEK